MLQDSEFVVVGHAKRSGTLLKSIPVAEDTIYDIINPSKYLNQTLVIELDTIQEEDEEAYENCVHAEVRAIENLKRDAMNALFDTDASFAIEVACADTSLIDSYSGDRLNIGGGCNSSAAITESVSLPVIYEDEEIELKKAADISHSASQPETRLERESLFDRLNSPIRPRNAGSAHCFKRNKRREIIAKPTPHVRINRVIIDGDSLNQRTNMFF